MAINEKLLQEELLQYEDVEIVLIQRGKTEEEALQNIFNQLRRDIHSHIDGYLMEMHVGSVILLRKEVREKIKRFLFFFFPVEHRTVTLEMKLKISVTSIKR